MMTVDELRAKTDAELTALRLFLSSHLWYVEAELEARRYANYKQRRPQADLTPEDLQTKRGLRKGK